MPGTRKCRTAAAPVDPVESARAAGLRYVTDVSPGIRRELAALGWIFTAPDGTVIDDEETIARIRKLAIPPAWTDVWICPSPKGHLQATGRDAKGRKQYRYHARWREVRDETKYDRLIAFGEALPNIRARTERDLALPRLPRQKVLATVVQLLEKTLIRVGNDEYAKQNKSFGLTTMRDRHVAVNGSTVRFEFRGKSGKAHAIDLRNRKLAAHRQALSRPPGLRAVPVHRRERGPAGVDSSDVNAYLREITGEDFTAKDFRTWAGTVLAARALRELPSETANEAKKNLVQAIEAVAGLLGNTKSVCRKCYIHPAIIDSYLDRSLLETLEQRADAALAASDGLRPDEVSVLKFLRKRLEKEKAA